MIKLALLIACVVGPHGEPTCPPHQVFARYITGAEDFPSLAACLEQRDLIRMQANVFVLSAECTGPQGLAAPDSMRLVR